MKLNTDRIDEAVLCREFVRQARSFFESYPQIKHTLSVDDDEDHCILDIPEETPDGFPVTVEVEPEQITVYALGAHTSEGPEGNPVDFVARTLGFVQDLLGPNMRVREVCAGGKPHKWGIEILQNGQWQTEEWTGLIFWNYFGKKSERIYMNRILPARENPVETSDLHREDRR
ncbi:MAG: hypothetical protein GX455_17290 [Phycisphaerae bacterium]|nr:hypothetical protein [Phycisphaerae bacterium]